MVLAYFSLLNKFFNITQSGYPSFSDVNPEDWFYFQIGSAHEKGYINGFPDGSFKPDNYITRMETFVMIYNLLGAPEYSNTAALDGYRDVNYIPSDKPAYRQIVAYMAGNGIINAYPDGSLRVNDFLTRAEMLSLLNKLGDMITNSNSPSLEPAPELKPSATETPAPATEEAPTPITETPAGITETPAPLAETPGLTLTPAPEANHNNWPAPKRPGNEWYPTTTGSGLTASMNTENPRRLARSGFIPQNENSPLPGAEPESLADQNNYDKIQESLEPIKNNLKIVPPNLFYAMSGDIDIQENAIIIKDADPAYLYHEYTLPKGARLELINSTLILMGDLNVIDESGLAGDKYSEIIERGGILNIGNDEAIRSRRAEITPDTYYYNVKKGRWNARK